MKETKIPTLLGRRIKALRKSKGLTQEALGENCGVNYKFLGGIERGRENPSLSILMKISKGLGTQLSELFKFDHEETDPAKLKKIIIGFIKDETAESLQLILKIIKAIK